MVVTCSPAFRFPLSAFRFLLSVFLVPIEAGSMLEQNEVGRGE
jgi:hypothetical protein